MPLLESLAIGSGIAKSGLGLVQAWKSARMRPQRPEYEIPSALTESTNVARSLVNSGNRPGRSIADEQIRRTTANMIDSARGASNSGTELLAAVSAANNNENQAMRQQDQMDANFGLQANNMLLQALNQMASAQDRKFEINQMQPFLDKAKTKAALTQSGLLNLFGGADDIMQFLSTQDSGASSSSTV